MSVKRKRGGRGSDVEHTAAAASGGGGGGSIIISGGGGSSQKDPLRPQALPKRSRMQY